MSDIGTFVLKWIPFVWWDVPQVPSWICTINCQCQTQFNGSLHLSGVCYSLRIPCHVCSHQLLSGTALWVAEWGNLVSIHTSGEAFSTLPKSSEWEKLSRHPWTGGLTFIISTSVHGRKGEQLVGRLVDFSTFILAYRASTWGTASVEGPLVNWAWLLVPWGVIQSTNDLTGGLVWWR